MGCEDSRLKDIQNIKESTSNVRFRANKDNKKIKSIGQKNINGEMTQNIIKINKIKTKEDLEFIYSVIDQHFLLFKLTPSEKKNLAQVMEPYTTPVEDYVFQQGSIATMFFIINSGKVQIQKNGSVQKTMERGDYFGELAFLYSAPRNVSVKVLNESVFWCLCKSEFLRVQSQMVKKSYKMAKALVYKYPLFDCLSIKQKDSISYNMFQLKYEVNDIIFNESDTPTLFYVIIEGQVEIKASQMQGLILKKGDSFGENYLKPQNMRSTAISLSSSKLLAINNENLHFCIGEKSKTSLFLHSIIKWALRRSKLFQKFTFYEHEEMIKYGAILYKRDGQIIAKQGEFNDYLYICLEQSINNYEAGSIINQTYANDSEYQQFICQETLAKKGDGFIYQITIKQLAEIFYKFKTSAETIQESIIQANQQKTRKAFLNSIDIDLTDFMVLNKLGKSVKCKYLLVQNNKTRIKYILKCVEKSNIIKNNLQTNITQEKEILEMCYFPLIVKLIKTHKDSHFIYFLMEYIEGVNFQQIYRDIQLYSNNISRFYFGCCFLCIEYLHKNSIVHRDLKIQNFVLDSLGYLHLISLDSAKQLNENDQFGMRTFTIIGTPHYMAPQIMQAKGYSFSVDIWSLGIMFYQILCGLLPFGNQATDPSQIYEQIFTKEIVFPDRYSNKDGKELILKLLEKHPQKRAIQDFSEIKRMKYFKNFNWKHLQKQKIKPPIQPNIPEIKCKYKNKSFSSYIGKKIQQMSKPLPSQFQDWDTIF